MTNNGYFRRGPDPLSPENEIAALGVGAQHGDKEIGNDQASDTEHSADEALWKWPLHVATDIQVLQLEFYERAEQQLGSPDWCRFERELGVDHRVLYANAGMVTVLPIRLHRDRRFTFDDAGRLGVVLECLAEDGQTPLDLCAWPLDRPDAFVTALHRAEGLGVEQVTNPATWAFGGALMVHRTPLSWLRSGCRGVVPLDERSAPAWLGRAPGCLVVDDVEHGAVVSRMVGRAVARSKILAPVRRAA